MPEPVFMKFVMYIMAPETISNGMLHKFLLSVCLYVYSPIVARQRTGKRNYRCYEYARNRRTVGRVVFYAVSVVPKESRQLVLPRTFSFNRSQHESESDCWFEISQNLTTHLYAQLFPMSVAKCTWLFASGTTAPAQQYSDNYHHILRCQIYK
jgi:hypothetical protein